MRAFKVLQTFQKIPGAQVMEHLTGQIGGGEQTGSQDTSQCTVK